MKCRLTDGRQGIWSALRCGFLTFTVADKQGIRLKMHEMAILETLIFNNSWGVGMHTNKHDQHLGTLKLGVYVRMMIHQSMPGLIFF